MRVQRISFKAAQCNYDDMTPEDFEYSGTVSERDEEDRSDDEE